jgi:hypothetical protein
MKTKEQIQEQLNTYFEKASKHVYLKKTLFGDKYLKIVGTKTLDGDIRWLAFLLDENLTPINLLLDFTLKDIDNSNSKCDFKHQLFLNKNMKSVKLKNKTQWINEVLMEATSQLPTPSNYYEESSAYHTMLFNRLKVSKEGV